MCGFYSEIYAFDMLMPIQAARHRVRWMPGLV